MDGEKYQSLKIENIVFVGSLAGTLDIEYIADKLDGCVLNRKRFPGAVYHMQEPKVTVLLFSSGKVVMTGITRNDDFQKGLDGLIRQVNDLGVMTHATPDVSIKNMVCSYDTGVFINLNKLIGMFNYEKIEYEPEQFPGLVYRMTDPKIVALIFSSGKVILTGGKNIDDVKSAIDHITKNLEYLQ
jgi:transcription initiation factor TFIID TATA-box-binding protein